MPQPEFVSLVIQAVVFAQVQLQTVLLVQVEERNQWTVTNATL